MTPGNTFQHALTQHTKAYQSFLDCDKTVLSFFLNGQGCEYAMESENTSAHRSIEREALKPADAILLTAWNTLVDAVPFLTLPYSLGIIMETDTAPEYTLYCLDQRICSPTPDHPLNWRLDALSALGPGDQEAMIGSAELYAHTPEEALMAHYIFRHPNKINQAHKTPKRVSFSTNSNKLLDLREKICAAPNAGPLFTHTDKG